MRRAAPLVCAGLVLVVLLGGCASNSTPSSQAAPSAPPTAAAFSPAPLPTCPPVRPKPYAWPKQVPQDLPQLPGAELGKTTVTADGLFILKFSTPTSLRDGVLFIVRQLPAAGYTLGRGDAEPAEADAPFAKGDLRGVLRGALISTCSTSWILAVTRTSLGTGTPLLPLHRGPSPTPLPFG